MKYNRLIAPEFLIRNIISELLFNSRMCESMEQQQTVNHVYQKLYEARLLYGEPVTVPELRKILRQKIVNFVFIKLDGEVRPAKGTTMMKYIPQEQHPKGIRPSSPKVATFYDLEKMDWRSVSQRSKEIVLDKDEETGKPVIMVKDKPKGGDVGVSDKRDTIPIDSTDIDTQGDRDGVEVKNIKPVKSTDATQTFYFTNPKTGATKELETTASGAIEELKNLGKDWLVVDDKEIMAAAGEDGDYINVGDIRDYLTRRGENVPVQITGESPDGGYYARTQRGTNFYISPYNIQKIGSILDPELEETPENIETPQQEDDIIDKLAKTHDLNNIEANEI